ncbi:HAD family hydrolase [Streptomyces sp. CRN 30]|uniref:D-glycero-alpha-D-manno-heptose-1,7-bisphosphate 7-phosphatase n=1 Tax=Streptomyces sp. CRN 30 TaxID=3075613 RepID=UPI002A81728D|nr:HAD family hydrolase [Streptomyces sp. CRN 30]
MSTVKAVLFDRDGTLVHDVPYNGDPARVEPVDGAREALGLLRAHGIRTGVVTNQSGVARGLLTDADVRRVHARLDELLGPFDVFAVCPHGPDDGCACRKPRPGMILKAAGRIGADPADCVVIGDIGADVEAARRAGAHGILVPNTATRPEETATADHVAPNLLTAVRAVLTGPPKGRVLVDERPLEAAYAPATGGTDPCGRPR